MTLHPQARALCDLVHAATADAPPPSDETLQQARDGLAALFAAGAGTPASVHSVEDRDAAGVPVRVYRPSGRADLPVVVFFHGGGWTLADVDVYDPTARAVAAASGAVVVSVGYRLAPEHPFPAPLDDCWHALEWVARNAGDLGADGSRLVVMGDSAGGNLAAVCALLARDRGGPRLALQVLVYPVTDTAFDTVSYAQNAQGHVLEAAQMRWFLDCYTRGRCRPVRLAHRAAARPRRRGGRARARDHRRARPAARRGRGVRRAPAGRGGAGRAPALRRDGPSVLLAARAARRRPGRTRAGRGRDPARGRLTWRSSTSPASWPT
ncbi:MAG: hypothetical protein KatS3mg009_3040 [Acidimicrobiia bacterium]|nr:MAG: hypothetical protein KatS3mg009_3040 [Acidimicrobiia bacterium]